MRTSDIPAIAQRLSQTPPPERDLTPAAALKMLAPVLKKMKADGHTVESIHAALNSEGLTVSRRSVAQVLRKPRSPKTKLAKKSAENTSCLSGCSDGESI